MTKILSQISLVAVVLITSAFPASAQTDHAQLLPRNTIAAFSILDFERWQSRWNNSGLAKYFAEPAMQEFTKNASARALEVSPWLSVVSFSSIQDIADGQVTFAIAEVESGHSQVMLVDAQDATAAANWITALSKRMQERNAIQSDKSIGGFKVKLLVFPESNQQLAICYARNLIVVSTNPEWIENLLAKVDKRFDGKTEFKSTVAKARAECSDTPLFWWYVQPIDLLKQFGRRKRNDTADIYKMATTQGFDAIRAVGGIGIASADNGALSARGYIAAGKPYTKAMRLLDLPNAPVPAIPQWCSRGSSAGFLNVQTRKFLPSFATLFDAVVGDGEEGVLEAVLVDLKTAANGPKIDLQRELFEQLDARAYFSTSLTQNSNVTLIGMKAANPNKVTAAVNKMFEGDSRASRQQEVDYVVWNVLPIEDGSSEINQPFVIAIRDGFLLLAPTVSAIEAAFDYELNNETPLQFLDSGSSGFQTSSFAFYADVQKLAKVRHEQLRSGVVTGLIGLILERAKLKEVVEHVDRSKLPDFSEVQQHFDFKIKFRGQSNASGWKIWIGSGK